MEVSYEHVLTGLAVKEQAGYGIIDIKLYHVRMPL